MTRIFDYGDKDSACKALQNMRKPFVLIIETDNVYLDDYDSFQNMGNLLIELGQQIKRTGHGLHGNLIRDRKGTTIGQYDWS